MPPVNSAACSGRRTAARRGTACCSATRRPARSTCRWTRTPRTCCTPALWEVFRTPHSLSSGGPGSGLFKSTDGGTTWTELTKNPGLPAGLWGKVGVAVSPADGKRVYAIVENENGGVFVSDDGGATWTLANGERRLRQRAFYYTRIYADTEGPRHRLRAEHGLLPIDRRRQDLPGIPRAARRQPRPVDRAERPEADDQRQRRRRQRVGERRRVVDGPGLPDRAVLQRVRHGARAVSRLRRAAGQQHGVRVERRTAASSTTSGAARAATSRRTRAIPTCSTRAATAATSRATTGGRGATRAINVWPDNPMGYSAKDITERFQWTYPDRVLAGRPAGALRRLAARLEDDERGAELGADQPRPDAARPGDHGAVRRADHARSDGRRDVRDGVHDRAVAARRQTIWTGSDDGLIHVTRDGGKTWNNVTPKDLPEFARISLIEASPHKPGTAFVAANRYQRDDRAPYVYRTDDFGKTWTKIVGGLPATDFARAIREDLKKPGLLYLGTEHGIYVSFNDGGGVAVAAPRPAGHAGARHRLDRDGPGDRHARPVVLHPRQRRDPAAVHAGPARRNPCICSLRRLPCGRSIAACRSTTS